MNSPERLPSETHNDPLRRWRPCATCAAISSNDASAADGLVIRCHVDRSGNVQRLVVALPQKKTNVSLAGHIRQISFAELNIRFPSSNTDLTRSSEPMRINALPWTDEPGMNDNS